VLVRVRRAKPYVCVDCDYAEHFRFQKTKDVDGAAGTWLRCLAHSRAQEQDGIVTAAWIHRTFARRMKRIEELVSVGLLHKRDDGDYELHAYAPRNQTHAMLEEERATTRERVSAWRERAPSATESVTADARSATSRPRAKKTITERSPIELAASANVSSLAVATRSPDAPGAPSSSTISSTADSEVAETSPELSENPSREGEASGAAVTMYERVTNAFVPTSTSTSISTSTSTSSSLSEVGEREEGRVQRGETRGDPGAVPERHPLPPSERGVSGPLWLRAFTEGVTAHTGRPCTAGRVYLGTLERLVGHHAPDRNAASACGWIREQARAFAAQWDGKHPAKGLTPDGLERWLNDGRHGPPEFGRPRIVQPSAEDWHEDDWSDLGAEVLR
jgi:hypothetical protein